VTSKVVGVVRNLDDVQSSGAGKLSEGIPGDFNVAAGPAWMAAHAAGFPGYGSAVLVRLRSGPSSVKPFEALLNTAPGGWFNQASPVIDTDTGSIRRVIDLERNALLVFAAVAILAGVAFVGLTLMRQLTRESAESELLLALGMTRRDLHVLNVVRALTIAAGACVVAVVTVVALSPLGPLGLARKLEFDLGVRLDLLVIVSTVLAIVLSFALAGLVTPVATGDHDAARVRVRPSRFDPALRVIGPVATVGATVARGRSSRAAVAVTAVAVAAGIAAGSLIASYDRLASEPRRYGAWWDVAVGQYSEPSALEEGVAKLRANPAVDAAAGYLEQADVAAVDGSSTRILALQRYVGHRGPVMARGRAPTSDSEVALGRATARRIHKSVGDQVTVVSSDDTKLRLRVVGIVVVNDPVSPQASAGDGAFIRPSVYDALAGPGSIPQSIVIRLDPHRDRAAAIESVRRDFAGSIREVTPQVGARDLGRLRTVPWLIAGLIALLALATFVHALVTVLGRNRTTLAVLAVLGFRRRQRRRVGLFAGLLLVALGIAIGIPAGLLLGSAVWAAVANGIDLPSGAVLAWPVAVAAAIAAIGVAVVVALVAGTGPLRTTPSEQLRVE
jgi:predicted lysophospholipase L1 biosynthesis ABC-type transport system permease subunit